MSENKGFFAPSWDFFSWAAIKNVLTISASLAYRTFCSFFKSVGLGSALLVIFFASSLLQTMDRMVLQAYVTSLVEALGFSSSSYSATQIIVLMICVVGIAAAAFALGNFIFVRILMIMHNLSASSASREDVPRKFRQNFVLCLLLGAQYLWAFSLLFFIDARSENRSLKTSFVQALWMALRLLPALILFMVVGTSWFFVPEFLIGVLGAVINIKFDLQGVYAMFMFIPMAFIGLVSTFFRLALFHTLYVKTLEKHGELFGKEA